MKENRITITINKSVEDVFEFTTNPINTRYWISSIQEESSDEFPPKIGTRYKNRGKNFEWDFYKVVEYEPFKIFTLSDLEGNYRYIDAAVMPFYIGSGAGDYAFYYDDIYIDETLARIELCDNETWNNRQKCEMQIPQTWNDNTITFKANQGTFQNTQTAYLGVLR